ncbi:MAG: hypothetical protein QNK37_20355 [Acidobacteriota bacterium]|nr:hypothetical protein [Acidobacteriota bacterium]
MKRVSMFLLLLFLVPTGMTPLIAFQDEKPAEEKKEEGGEAKKDEGGEKKEEPKAEEKKEEPKAEETKEEEKKEKKKTKGDPTPEIDDEDVQSWFEPDIPIEDFNANGMSVSLLLLSYKRADTQNLGTLFFKSDINLKVDYTIADYSINRLLSRLMLDKLALVEKQTYGVTVDHYSESDDPSAGDPTYINFFEPDVQLGRILPGTMPITTLLRRIAREKQVNLVVADDIGPLDTMTEPVYSLDELLNQLQDMGKVRIERDGELVYVYPKEDQKIAYDTSEPATEDVLDVLAALEDEGVLAIEPTAVGLVAKPTKNPADDIVFDPDSPPEILAEQLNRLLNTMQDNGTALVEIEGEDRLAIFPMKEPDNLIIYDQTKEKIAFGLKDAPLETLVRDLIETTGKTVLLSQELNTPEQLASLEPIVGDQGPLPFKNGLESLLAANGLGLEETEGVFMVKPRVQGVRRCADPGMLDIYVVDRPLNEVIRNISDVYQEDVVVLEKLEGTVSIDLNCVDIGELLNLLLADTQYSFSVEDGSYLIGSSKLPLLNAKQLVRFDKVHAKLVFDMIPEDVKKEVTIVAVNELNALLIMGQRKAVRNAAEIAALLNEPVAQVLLEVVVVKYSLTDDFELGVNLTTPDGGTLFPNFSQTFQGFQDEHGNYRISRLPSNFTALLTALENEGKAKTLMKPKIATLSGQEANITISDTINYKITKTTIIQDPSGGSPLIENSESIEEAKADVKLKITPWVMSESLVTVTVEPEFASFNNQSVGTDVPSGTSTQSLLSTVRLNSGETIILGGMVTDTQSVSRNGLPYLSRVPLLGALFRNKSKSVALDDMIIYVTPHVYYGLEEAGEVVPEEKVDQELDKVFPSKFQRWREKRKKKKKSSSR